MIWRSPIFVRISPSLNRKSVTLMLSAPRQVIYSEIHSTPNVNQKAVAKFPLLKSFKDFWVVNDFLKMRLKYTAEQRRKKAKKLTGETTKKLTRVRAIILSRSASFDFCSRRPN